MVTGKEEGGRILGVAGRSYDGMEGGVPGVCVCVCLGKMGHPCLLGGYRLIPRLLPLCAQKGGGAWE